VNLTIDDRSIELLAARRRSGLVFIGAVFRTIEVSQLELKVSANSGMGSCANANSNITSNVPSYGDIDHKAVRVALLR
jgi:hypothetical protein